ncbi:hypothetical protein [Pandoraea terrae]|nr:hypothetical protein [Pandoraea terrae]
MSMLALPYAVEGKFANDTTTTANVFDKFCPRLGFLKEGKH